GREAPAGEDLRGQRRSPRSGRGAGAELRILEGTAWRRPFYRRQGFSNEQPAPYGDRSAPPDPAVSSGERRLYADVPVSDAIVGGLQGEPNCSNDDGFRTPEARNGAFAGTGGLVDGSKQFREHLSGGLSAQPGVP